MGSQGRKRSDDSSAKLLGSIHSLELPGDSHINYYSGITWSQSSLPDNIVIFRRNNTRYFQMEGKGSNYHHRFELVIPLLASGIATLDDHSFHIAPGECALVFPHQYHRYSDIESENMDWLFTTFEIGDPTPLAGLRNHPRKLSQESLILVHRLIEAYVQSTESTQNWFGFFSALATLLQTLPDEPEIPNSQRDFRASTNEITTTADRITEYFNENLTEDTDMDSMSRDLGFSVSYLRAVFKKHFGISLGRYLREARLAQAAKLLQETNLKVSEIASRCSFGSPIAFSRSFKSTYGMSPKSYRNVTRGNGRNQ